MSVESGKKAIYVASIFAHFRAFHIPFLKMLQEDGNEVWAAARTTNEVDRNELERIGVKCIEIPFSRNPYSISNIKSYRLMRKLFRENHFDLVHVHTPAAAFIARAAARGTGQGKVIYTAHGFHFYKGAPFKNWLVYYTAEKMAEKWTDVLITINKEDFERAKRSFKTKWIEYIPGIGLDTQKYKENTVDRSIKRKELGLSDKDFVVISVGELNTNKNHEAIIRSLSLLNDSRIHYLVCGIGSLRDYLENLAMKLKLQNQVHLLGYRKDIAELCSASDIFAFPSKREGLGRSALEAMACGLPLVTSNVHGIVDYSENGITGYSCNPKDISCFADSIAKLVSSSELRKKMGENNSISVANFDIQKVLVRMREIYSELFSHG